MGKPRPAVTRLSAAAAGLALLAAPLAVAPAQADQASTDHATAAAFKPAKKKKTKPVVTAMTRNVYLGANIMRPIVAVQSVAPEPADSYQFRLLDALANATDTTRDIAGETDFSVRAKLLARELVEEKPDLVGLQEVAMWRTGPMDNPLGPDFLTPNAETVEYDFLKMLLREARAQGARYKAVSVNWLSDVEAPAYSGSYPGGTAQDPRDVRLTMRDVILKRKGSGLKVLKARERTFDAMLRIDIAGKDMDFRRGYQWVDVRKKKAKGPAKFRFINSHFEAFSSDIAFDQAREVVDGPGSVKRPVIFVCDCNSDPVDGSVKTDIGDTQPHWAPYWYITGKNKFTDTWLQLKQHQDGWTSGLNERVDAESAAGFDHRIDMVFGRTADGGRLKALSGSITGDELADRDEATGLWPSDHAGVVMKLRLR